MKKELLIAFLLGISPFARAQKLPNVQTNSLRAPANINIDGKNTEWDNKFQAYNKAIDAFYTIANDNDNLYLTLQVSDPYIINKIFSAGITFTINKADEKNDKNGVSITYPVINLGKRPYIDLRHKPHIDTNGGVPNTDPDSVVIANNMHIAGTFKLIRVTGVKGVDTLTSVYNREGVKTVGLFNNKMAYNYELSISLKNLGLSVSNSTKLAYSIKFNGATMNNLNGYYTGPLNPTTGMPSSVIIDPGSLLLSSDKIRLMTSTTDLTGEYTLLKK